MEGWREGRGSAISLASAQVCWEAEETLLLWYGWVGGGGSDTH